MTERIIPMSLWLPDFDKEELEETLEMEGIKCEQISNNILVANVKPIYFEYLQNNLRKVLTVPHDQPVVTTPLREAEVEVEIPDCIPDDADAAAAAAEAIEADLKAKTENPDFESEDETKASLCENIYRVLHNRKVMSVQLQGVELSDVRNRYVVNSVARIKGKPNDILMNMTCIEGRAKGTTKDVEKKWFLKIKEVDAKFLRKVLKEVNHSF